MPLGVVTDRSDGKLAHLDGLNISRAWMLEGVASGLFEAVVDVVFGHQFLEDVHLPVVVGLHEPAHERLVLLS